MSEGHGATEKKHLSGLRGVFMNTFYKAGATVCWLSTVGLAVGGVAELGAPFLLKAFGVMFVSGAEVVATGIRGAGDEVGLDADGQKKVTPAVADMSELDPAKVSRATRWAAACAVALSLGGGVGLGSLFNSSSAGEPTPEPVQSRANSRVDSYGYERAFYIRDGDENSGPKVIHL